MRALILIILLTVTAGFSVPSGKVLVCVSTGATKYHSYRCQGLKRCTHTVEEVTLPEAVKRGYTACGYCYK